LTVLIIFFNQQSILEEIFDISPDEDWETENLVPGLSPQQYFAVRFFRDRHSISELVKFKDFRHPSTISTCMERTAFGLR